MLGDPVPTASPIVRALLDVETVTPCEVRVHLSWRRREPDPLDSAQLVFSELLADAGDAVLFYVNLKARRFAIVASSTVHDRLGAKYWQGLADMLRDDLLSTHHENAIAIAARTVGASLAKFFPAILQ